MKCKTSDLKDIALDFMVAKAGGGKGDVWNFIAAHADRSMYHYSSDWARGGPIIERERLLIQPEIGKEGAGNAWSAVALKGHEKFGSTPLIAAMRCYVASKLGEEVEIPEELL